MKGSRLSEDWMPDAEQMAWARLRRPDLNLDEQIELFKNHWLDKTGKDATKVTWKRTFANWIIRAYPPRTLWQNAPTTRHKSPESTQRELSTIRRPHVTGMPTQAADLFRMLKITGE